MREAARKKADEALDALKPVGITRSRVEHLTGLRVGKIAIEISWLNPSSHVRKSLK